MHKVWKPLVLNDGSEVIVDERAYPMLVEWDWELLPGTEEVVRADNPLVRMYDEEVRLLSNRSDAFLPTRSWHSIRSLFAGMPEYAEMMDFAGKQRQALETGGIGFVSLPSAPVFLGCALSAVLAAYYRWLASPTCLIFRYDHSHLTPGWFNPSEKKSHYPTLGAWMHREPTGGWIAEPKAPCGLIPEPMYSEVVRLVTKEWIALLRERNLKVKPKNIEAHLKEVELPVWMLVEYAIQLIETYPV